MINLSHYDSSELWCGVFQGGGARGAAYAGALQALHVRHQWFSAVAGSSAGAISACLVAACLEPSDIREQTPRLMAAVRPASPIDRAVHALGWRHAVRYDSDALEAQLNRLLRTAIAARASVPSGERPGPVTFAELYEATQVRLYVIVGDASTGVPVPFCAETTPHLSVAGAVIASCSIPVVFAPRFAAVDTTAFGGLGGPVLRRLQDGGLWANFPAFTFTDHAFRAYHGLDPNVNGRVLGFTLMYDLTLPARIDRFVDVPTQHRVLAQTLSAPADSRARPASSWSAAVRLSRRSFVPIVCLLCAVLLLLSDTTRAEMVLPAAVAALIGIIGLGTLSWRLANLVLANAPIAIGGLFSGYAWVLASEPAPTWHPVAAILVAGVAATLILAGLMMHRVLERTAVGLHGLLTIVTGQTIRPAPWVDQLPGSHLVYVRTGTLELLSFDADIRTIDEAVQAAHDSSAVQLDRILTGQPNDVLSRVVAALAQDTRTSPDPDSTPLLRHLSQDQ